MAAPPALTDIANNNQPATTEPGTDVSTLPPPMGAPPPPPPVAAGPAKMKMSPTTRSAKKMDIFYDSWFFEEINRRDAKDAGLFRNYQINPYTKKTLDYCTPKPNEKKLCIPTNCAPDGCWACCDNCWGKMNGPCTDFDRNLIESYKLVKNALDRSVAVPQKKYCEPQTELMRLGWFPKMAPPPKPKTCLYLCMKHTETPTPCCYFYPTPAAEQYNEAYDERFRAVHQTAEFIHTAAALRRHDSIMNPNGLRGAIRNEKVSRPKWKT